MQIVSAIMMALCLSLSAAAQSKIPGAGHWEGTLSTPDRDLKISFDLGQNEKSEWIGHLDLPEMRIDGAPLARIVVKGTNVSFGIAGLPGEAGFEGQLSADGKELKGDVNSPGGPVPTVLKWISEPHVKLPPKSTPITREMEGTWEGKLTPPNGGELRIRLKLANAPEGATGVLVSLDQGAQELPLSGIAQNGNSLKFELKIAGGAFEGQLKDGALAGEWSQGGGTLPITFRKAAEEKK